MIVSKTMLTVRFDEAVRFASRLHCSQLRKGTQIPYLSHLLAVSSLVMEHGGSEDQAIAALLHDAIEDCGATYAAGRDGLRRQIRELFGPLVLEIVNGCTDDEGFEKSEWRERKLQYLYHLDTASSPVKLVSCADKVHNARCLLADYRSKGNLIWQRFRTKSAADQLWYYSELCRRFAGDPGDLAAELTRTVEELRRLCEGSKAE
jgi:(p)ppGpp synthase/HD superfamily hydrolase